MDTAILQKFYDVARAASVDMVYIAYIEEALLGRPFDGEELAQQILDTAVAHHEQRLRKRVNNIIKADCTNTASEMIIARHFARTNGGLYAYINYVEQLVTEKKPFNMQDCVECVFNNIMGDYKLRLARKIANATGINLGGNDAV